MKLTQFTKDALTARRASRDMTKRGYQRIEGPWEIIRGGRWREVISDVVVDAGGKHVWVKTAAPPDAT